MTTQNDSQLVTTAAPEPPNTENDHRGMTLIQHLVELRNRLIRASIGVALGMVVGMFLVLGPVNLVDRIIEAFADTSREYAALQSVGTAETFTSYMSVALAVGVVLGMPVIVFQLLAFIVPGLTPREKRFLFTALPVVIVFFLVGIAFGWFITVPTATKFLIGFSDSPYIQTQPTVSDFLRVVTLLLLMNGIVFEMPIIIYVLALMGVVTAAQLGKYRRYAIVLVVIVAAIITPTGDPVNLTLLAVPMYLLFELGVVLARFAPKTERRLRKE